MRLVLAVVGAVALVGCGPLSKGPLEASEARWESGIPAGPDGAVTWGMPISPTSGSVVLQRVEPIDVDGLEVLAIKACEGSPWTGDSYLNCAPQSDQWPPPDVALREVEGATADASPEGAGGIIIGARLMEGVAEGTIGSLRISYTAGGADYVVTEPWSLRVTRGVRP